MKRIWLLLLLSLLFTVPTSTRSWAQTPAPAAAQLIDLNTASLEQLQAIKGIGPVYSKAIVAGRPYKRKDELVSKKILPKGIYDKIKDQIIAKQAK